MEFGEKLQNLRKSRGMTQEELAEALFVSRAAVSKWESGKGYPNIGSLKDISRFFSVTVDELICSEEILSAAEREQKAFVGRTISLLCASLDILPALLLFVPLFGNGAGGASPVSLLALSGVNPRVRLVCLLVVALTILNGVSAIAVSRLDKPVWNRHRLVTGLALSILGSAVFILSRQPYAAMLYFAPLVVKGVLVTQAKG